MLGIPNFFLAAIDVFWYTTVVLMVLVSGFVIISLIAYMR